MRIASLYLKAYGRFTERQIDLPADRGFHMIYGGNEAGKSTTLRAITSFLYGFEHQHGDDFVHSSSQLRVGARVIGEGGEQHELVRRKGRKDTLLDSEGRPVADALLAKLMGNLDQTLFTNIFGLDHQTLIQGGEELVTANGGVGESLFSAASGATGIQEIMQALDTQASDIFKRTGSKPELNQALNRYKELRQKINDLSLAPSNWEATEKEYQRQAEELDQLKQAIAQIAKRAAQLERIQRSLPLIAELQRHREELAAMGDVLTLPTIATSEREQWTQAQEIAATDRRRAETAIEALGQQLAGLQVSTTILDRAGEIRGLNERIESYRNQQKQRPHLQAEVAQHQQTVLALLQLVEPGRSSVAELDGLRVPLHLTEQIRRLTEQYNTLQQLLAQLRTRRDQIEEDLAKTQRDLDRLRGHHDLSCLQRALQHARQVGKVDNECDQLRLQISQAEAKLADGIRGLSLWQGSAEQLTTLPLPLKETIRAFADRAIRLEQRDAQLQAGVLEMDRQIAECQRQLEEIRLAGDVPTVEQLTTARQRRENGWQLVRKAWLEGQRSDEAEQEFDPAQPLASAYEQSVDKADQVSDHLRREAKRVAEKAALEDRIRALLEKVDELALTKNALTQDREQYAHEWSALWQSLAVEPLSPQEMIEWLERCVSLQTAAHGRREQQQRLQQLTSLSQQLCGELGTSLSEVGESGWQTGETLDDLVDRAEGIYQRLRDTKTRFDQLTESQADQKVKEEKARTEEDRLQAELAMWRANWSTAMTTLGISAEILPEAALARIEKLDELFRQKAELDSAQSQITTMQSAMASFQQQAHQLAVELMAESADLPAEVLVTRLGEQVTRVQQQITERQGYERQLQQAQQQLTVAKEDELKAQEQLERLMQQAGCQDLDALVIAEQRSQSYLQLASRIAELERLLLQGGAGLTLEQLIAETSGVDRDAIPFELRQAQAEQQAMDRRRTELEQVFGVTKASYEEQSQGRSSQASQIAQEAQSELARIQSLTTHYMRLRLAQSVLKRGIERYRAENQNTLLQRTAEIFSQITAGAFTDLQTDYDDKDRTVLLAVRANGQKVDIDGMSDGTQDQLFLAIRLASIEHYLKNGQPVPLVLDDILINFDDARSRATLRVLAEIAERVQVIFFTHHQALVEMAKDEIEPQKLNVVEL